MKNLFIHTIVCATIIGLLFACNKKEIDPSESFIKVYHEVKGNTTIHPIAMHQTADKGYFILNAIDGWKIQLMKIDSEGELVWKKTLDQPYVSATNLIKHKGEFYIVCMEEVGLYTILLQVDQSNGNLSEVNRFTSIDYPLAAFSNDQDFYIMNYERYTFQTGVYKLDQSLTGISQSGEVDINTNVEQRIYDHLSYTGRRMPFLISTTPENDRIVLSCFNNYSFSLVFLDANLEYKGVYNGANFNGGINAVYPLGSNKFAVGRFSFDNFYFNPAASLSTTSIHIAEDIDALGYAEIDPTKPVVVKAIHVDGQNVVVKAASTRSNQVLLSFFNRANGSIIGQKYISQNVPIRVADIVNAEGEGLMLLLEAKIMGAYNRAATIKLTKDQVSASISFDE